MKNRESHFLKNRKEKQAVAKGRVEKIMIMMGMEKMEDSLNP